jgi:hypothetical protein
MAKLWLPLNRFTVKSGDREMQVIIPRTGDASYDEYLEQAEREKTAEQLRKSPPKPQSTLSRKQIGEALNEFNQFLLRKKRGDIRRYY